VAHVLATLLRFSGVLAAERPGSDVLASPAHRALAREAAAKSVVLLRNEPVDGVPVLPLEPGPAPARGPARRAGPISAISVTGGRATCGQRAW